MLSLPPSVRIFLHTRSTDMRKGFDGLAALVVEHFGQDPLSGHLFVFRGRRGDRLKVLWWDRDGYALWMKRLEKGVFRLPAGPSDAAGVEVSCADLLMLLEGIEPAGIRRSKRFVPKKTGIPAQEVLRP